MYGHFQILSLKIDLLTIRLFINSALRHKYGYLVPTFDDALMSIGNDKQLKKK